MEDGRRKFLKNIGRASFGIAALPILSSFKLEEMESLMITKSNLSAKELAQDESFWQNIQRAYNMSTDFINLENGYFSPQPSLGLETFIRNTRQVNEMPSYYMRTIRNDKVDNAKKVLADFAGVSVEEMVITRNSTEALNIVIAGLDLNPGDEVIINNQDYGSMIEAFEQRAKRTGIVLKRIKIPLHPKDSNEIVKLFEKAITPKTKVMLVTHMINLTGQILPAREICDMAHSKGVEVIVDGAHSFAHVDQKISDLNCDYYGTSLHKWLCGPMGTGLLYVKKEKIKKVWPLFGDTRYEIDDIKKFEHMGTRPPQAEITLEYSIEFHNLIGSKRKEERLRYLKNYWIEKVKDLPKVIINTPMGDQQSCAIGNFAIEGMKPKEVSDYLFKSHKVFTVAIDAEEVKGVRVTPHVYNTIKDLDALVQSITELSNAEK